MSTWFNASLTCPSCAHEFVTEIVRGIHITRLPQCREEIMRGEFQARRCPACDRRVVIESSTVYTDFDRHHYVAVESVASATVQSAEVQHKTIFEESFNGGPPIAREMGRRFKRRLVFGYGALREKLVLWDAGFDDFVVEAVKGDLVAADGRWSPETCQLRIATVLDGGHLMFAVLPPRPRPEPGTAVVHEVEPLDFLTAASARYQSRLVNRGRIAGDFPWLHSDWLVDLSETAGLLDG
jgi:hypothetical protein